MKGRMYYSERQHYGRLPLSAKVVYRLWRLFW